MMHYDLMHSKSIKHFEDNKTKIFYQNPKLMQAIEKHSKLLSSVSWSGRAWRRHREQIFCYFSCKLIRSSFRTLFRGKMCDTREEKTASWTIGKHIKIPFGGDQSAAAWINIKNITRGELFPFHCDRWCTKKRCIMTQLQLHSEELFPSGNALKTFLLVAVFAFAIIPFY